MALPGRRTLVTLAVLFLPAASLTVVSASSALACTEGLFDNVRLADGSWQGWSQFSGPPGGQAYMTSAVSSDGANDLHVDVINGGGIWDNVHDGITGTWQGWAKPTQPPGSPVSIADAYEPDGSMQMLAYTSSGLYHDIRYANGSWQGWNATVQPFPASSGDFGELAATGMANGDMVVIVGAAGGIWHADVRYAGGSWSGWSTLPGVPGTGVEMAVTGTHDGDLQALAFSENGKIYHNIWYAYSSWQGWGAPTQPFDVSKTSILTAAAMPDGDVHFMDLVNGGDNKGFGWLYHDIRFNSGSWQGWGQPANPPGPLRYFGDLSITAPTFLGYDDDTLYVTAQTDSCP